MTQGFQEKVFLRIMMEIPAKNKVCLNMFELYMVINAMKDMPLNDLNWESKRFMTGRYGYGSCVQGYR